MGPGLRAARFLLNSLLPPVANVVVVVGLEGRREGKWMSHHYVKRVRTRVTQSTSTPDLSTHRWVLEMALLLLLLPGTGGTKAEVRPTRAAAKAMTAALESFMIVTWELVGRRLWM
jgi:hypothetical protein